MKNLRIVVLGTAALGIAFSGITLAGKAEIAAEPLEIEEAEEEPAESAPGFTDEELRRLGELRIWLAQRKREQDGGADPKRFSQGMADAADQQLLTPLGQRYAKSFRSRGSGPNRKIPTLSIGRGPDGRIHHRYIFGGSEESEAGPTSPYYGYSSSQQAGRRHLPGHGRVRMWPPQPADQKTAPHLDYELPDQRR